MTASRQFELLACLLINVSLFREMESLDPVLKEKLDPFSKLWLSELSAYFELYGEMPTIDQFRQNMGSALGEQADQEEARLNAGMAMRAIKVAVEMSQTLDKDQVLKAGRSMMRARLEELETITLAEELQAEGMTLQAVLEEAKKRYLKIMSVEVTRYERPFEAGLEFPANNFQATGINFIDEMCGGGLCGGEVIGHSAPIGSGKTTLCLQVIWTRVEQIMAAYRGRPLEEIPFKTLPRIYGFFYESVVNLLPTFVSGAANISRSTMMSYFTGAIGLDGFSSQAKRNYKDYEYAMYGELIEQAKKGNSPWPYGEYERYQRIAAISNELLMLVDYSGNKPALSDWAGEAVIGMRNFLEGHQDKEGDPGVNFVVCDYVGIMCSRWQASSRDSHVRRADRHQMLKDSVSQMVQHVAAPYNCPVWASHQLNSEENKRSGGLAPNPMNNEGTGMFLENCSIGFASGRLDTKENAAVFVHAKQRRGGLLPDYICHLGRTYARWEDARHLFELADGQLMRKSELANNRYGEPSVPGKGRNVPPVAGRSLVPEGLL